MLLFKIDSQDKESRFLHAVSNKVVGQYYLNCFHFHRPLSLRAYNI